MGLFSRLKSGLSKTRTQIGSIISGKTVFDDEFYELLEDALVSADIGLDISMEIIERLRDKINQDNITTVVDAYSCLKDMIVDDLSQKKTNSTLSSKPHVILVIGVNGVGKTTTIGKMANEYQKQGKKVMFGAVDTFRAGAIEQLKIWADRTNSDFIAQHEGADPASVAYDSLDAAKARGIDVLFLDTAGRLHNKINLMNELEKIVRVLKRNTPDTPNEVLLVIDATTGQNALKQTEVFNKILGLTGLIITKLDGTAKGGIILALTRKYSVSIRKIGVGEGIEDLQDFDPKTFVEAMFGNIEK